MNFLFLSLKKYKENYQRKKIVKVLVDMLKKSESSNSIFNFEINTLWNSYEWNHQLILDVVKDIELMKKLNLKYTHGFEILNYQYNTFSIIVSVNNSEGVDRITLFEFFSKALKVVNPQNQYSLNLLNWNKNHVERRKILILQPSSKLRKTETEPWTGF